METLYRCHFEYGQVLTAEEREQFQELVGEEVETQGEEREDGGIEVKSWHSFDVAPMQFKELFPDMKITIGEALPANHAYAISTDLASIHEKLKDLTKMLRNIEASKGDPGLPNKPRYSDLGDGEAKAAIPEPYFMMIKELKVLTNACTDEVNGYLTDGPWHIVAICPQPGQRRPDYILCRI